MPTALETRLKRENALLKKRNKAIDKARFEEIDQHGRILESWQSKIDGLERDLAIAKETALSNAHDAAMARADAHQVSLLRLEVVNLCSLLDAQRALTKALDTQRREMAATLEGWVRLHEKTEAGQLMLKTTELLSQEVG